MANYCVANGNDLQFALREMTDTFTSGTGNGGIMHMEFEEAGERGDCRR
jgi:hypothetical protein